MYVWKLMTTLMTWNVLIIVLLGSEFHENKAAELRSPEFVEPSSAAVTSPPGKASLGTPDDSDPSDRSRAESTETGQEKDDVGQNGRSKAVLFSVERLLGMRDPDIGRHRQLHGQPYLSLSRRSTDLVPGHRWPVSPIAMFATGTEPLTGSCETQTDDVTTLTSSSTSSLSHRGYRSSSYRLSRHELALPSPLLRPSHYFQGTSPSRTEDSSLPVESPLLDWCLVTQPGLHGHRCAPYPLPSTISRYHRGSLDTSSSAFLANSEVEVERCGLRGERDGSSAHRLTTAAATSFARYRRIRGTTGDGGGSRQQGGISPPCLDVDAPPLHVTNDLQRIERMVRGLEHRHQTLNNSCTDLVF